MTTIAKRSTDPQRRTVSIALVVVSVLAHLGSLFAPAFVYEHHTGPQTMAGWQALFFGLAGVLNWHFEWFANLALCVAWIQILSSRRGAAVSWSLAALALAASFLLRDGIWVWEGPERAYRALAGYYIWLGSITVAAVAAGLTAPAKPGASPVHAA